MRVTANTQKHAHVAFFFFLNPKMRHTFFWILASIRHTPNTLQHAKKMQHAATRPRKYMRVVKGVNFFVQILINYTGFLSQFMQISMLESLF